MINISIREKFLTDLSEEVHSKTALGTALNSPGAGSALASRVFNKAADMVGTHFKTPLTIDF